MYKCVLVFTSISLSSSNTGSRVVCEEILKALENEEVDKFDGELLTVETHIDDEARIMKPFRTMKPSLMMKVFHHISAGSY